MADITNVKPTTVCHVVAMPYPGRSHINALMNICKRLASRKSDILITFVVTEEWLGLIGSDPKPDNIRFRTVPNVIPSEHGRAKDLPGFLEAVWTKLRGPFEELLDGVVHEAPVSAIAADSLLVWATKAGNRRNIPVASFWPLSASLFSVFYHFDLIKQNGHYPYQLSEQGHVVVDYIPGISSVRLADLLDRIVHKDDEKILQTDLEAVSMVSKAQYLLTTSLYELESQVFDVLKAKSPFPAIYPVGPTTLSFQLENSSSDTNVVPDYIQWLDSQPRSSVLYISFGSFLSVSSAQLDEIVAGIRSSGTRHMWVARDNASKIKDGCGNNGFVVPWCDQLRVLYHPSIGGFWTHCGWNSTLEAVSAGVPMLTYPIVGDQMHNSKQIVEDWKIGYKVSKDKIFEPDESLVTRDEILELVKRFMDPENIDGKLMRKRVKEVQKSCQQAIAKGGSADTNLDAFIRDISHGHCHY